METAVPQARDYRMRPARNWQYRAGTPGLLGQR
jgi:hypothetical protein